MFIFLFLLIANGDIPPVEKVFRPPPQLPALPLCYTRWDKDSVFYHMPLKNVPRETWPSHFPPCEYVYGLEDSNYLCKNGAKIPVIPEEGYAPFKIELEGLSFTEGCGDGSFGCFKYNDTASENKLSRVTVYWSPHEEGLTEEDIANRLYPRNPTTLFWGDEEHFAAAKRFKEISLNGMRAYRHRGRWLSINGCACGAIEDAGSFTVYLITTEKFDYHITCSAKTYGYDSNPWVGYPKEERDTLPRVLIYHYPNCIRELEQTVEETFESKEPSPFIPSAVGPPLPDGYTQWQPRKVFCHDGSELAYKSDSTGCWFHSGEINLPFTLESGEMKYGLTWTDSICGWVGIYSGILDTSYLYTVYEIEVYWRPRGNLLLDADTVRSELLSLFADTNQYICLESKGVEELTIKGNGAFRLRGYRFFAGFRNAKIEAVTAYLIHTERHDFVVICSSLVFDETRPEIHFREYLPLLEQVVERTFRVK